MYLGRDCKANLLVKIKKIDLNIFPKVFICMVFVSCILRKNNKNNIF